MDIVPVFERLGEELSTAKEENITEEEYSPHVAEEGSSSTEIDLSTVATPDTYQLNLSIVVTETDSEEIESEFSDALTEIHGEKSFPCTLCDKLCKSKGGLTRHTNSKHSTVVQPDSSFCMDTLASMIEKIKAKIMKEKLYGTDLNDSIKTATCTRDLYNAVYPIYKTFYVKKNQDNLVQSFFALIRQSSKLLDCENYKAANLIMIHLPDNFVGFYHTETNETESTEETGGIGETGDKSLSSKLDPIERGPLNYIAGYVVSKLFQACKKKGGKTNEELNLLLQNMKSSDQSSSFISARTRGGLVNPSKDLVGILEEAECFFRRQVDASKHLLRNIPTDTICNATIKSPVVKSLWNNIVMSSGVDPSSSTQKLCLENVIKLNLKVRSFSYARDFLTKYKIQEKQTKKKALRKELKLSDKKASV